MNNTKGLKTFGIIAIVLALLSWLLAVFLYTNTFGLTVTTDHERWGQFGDFMGGVLNPTFGLLSFFALLYTLFYQSKELSLSTQALEEQGKQLNVQAFESTLFSMLNLCRERVDNLEVDELRGNRALRKMYENLKEAYEAELILHEDTEESHYAMMRATYNRFISQNDVYIGSYLRLFDSLLKLIETSTLNERSKYWGVVRAQMTQYELLLVFYHSWLSNDCLNQDVLNYNSLFEYVQKGLLLDPVAHNTRINYSNLD